MHGASFDRLLALVRAARLSSPGGETCPYCRGPRVIRWGGFSRRQRYRCRDCRRTFSDFTGTPVAYSKRADLWLDYAEGMIGSETVRRSAARLNVARTTAFRLRHVILAAVRRAPEARLRGRISIAELVVRYSEKGSRRLTRPARRRGGGPPTGQDRVITVFGRTVDSDARATLAEVAGRAFLTSAMLQAALLPRVEAPCTLLVRAGAFSAYGTLAKRHGLTLAAPAPAPTGPAAGPPPAPGATSGIGDDAHALTRTFRSWLLTFRGVATRYLAHYLTWFRFVERMAARDATQAATVLLETAFAGPATVAATRG